MRVIYTNKYNSGIFICYNNFVVNFRHRNFSQQFLAIRCIQEHILRISVPINILECAMCASVNVGIQIPSIDVALQMLIRMQSINQNNVDKIKILGLFSLPLREWPSWLHWMLAIAVLCSNNSSLPVDERYIWNRIELNGFKSVNNLNNCSSGLINFSNWLSNLLNDRVLGTSHLCLGTNTNIDHLIAVYSSKFSVATFVNIDYLL